MPKSGSTFLSDAVAAAGGYAKKSFVPEYGRREQELCQNKLGGYKFKNIVGQHHVRYSTHTAKVMQKFDLRTVVLIRDLFDAAVSLRDHLRRESVVFPAAYFCEQDASRPDADLELMIARLAIPWYLNFYMSWRDVPGVLLMNYSEICSDPAGAVQKVLHFSGCSISREAVEKAIASIDPKPSRFNKGVMHRGSQINPAARDAIQQLIEHYGVTSDPYLSGMLESRCSVSRGAPINSLVFQ